MKKQIKAWLRKWLIEEETDFSPKKSGDLRAVAFESKQPVGNGKYHEYLFMCTEWANGEGYEFYLGWHYEGKNEDKTISLSTEQIEGILACLNDLNYFEV